jgi:hypothetical protein
MYGWTALIAYGAVGFARLPMALAVAVVAVGVVALVVLVAWPRRHQKLSV